MAEQSARLKRSSSSIYPVGTQSFSREGEMNVQLHGFKLVSLAMLSIALQACGGGGGEPAASSASVTNTTATTTTASNDPDIDIRIVGKIGRAHV